MYSQHAFCQFPEGFCSVSHVPDSYCVWAVKCETVGSQNSHRHRHSAHIFAGVFLFRSHERLFIHFYFTLVTFNANNLKVVILLAVRLCGFSRAPCQGATFSHSEHTRTVWNDYMPVKIDWTGRDTRAVSFTGVLRSHVLRSVLVLGTSLYIARRFLSM